MIKARRFVFLGLFLPWLALAEPAPEPVAGTETITEAPAEAPANEAPAAPAADPLPTPVTESPAAAPAVETAAAPAKPPVVIPEITNLAEIAKALKLKSFEGRNFVRKIKVAILDNGFNGYESVLGKSLPADTKYHPGKASDADKIPDPSFHGLFMAQIVTALIKESGAKAEFELHLFNAFGYTKFADAVETVAREPFDVVLYSQVWEYGGNGDGKGFINALVDKAVAAGVIWINATGNFGHLTRLAPVESKKSGDDEFVVFRNSKGKASDSVTVHCQMPAKETCNLRLVLSWNDFKDDPETGTDKDLDVILLDGKNNQIAIGDRNQRLKSDPSDPKSSIIPRELVEQAIPSGSYKIRVKNKSKNFDPAKDQLRITVSGRAIELAGATTGETLLPPADNAGVITFGAADDFQTNVSKKMGRPDVYVKSLVKLKDGSDPFSTSNAAAMGAALAVLHIGTGVEKDRDVLTEKLKSVTVKPQTTPPAPGPAPAPQEQQVAGRRDSRRQQQPARVQDYSDFYRRRPYRGEPLPVGEADGYQPGYRRPQQNCLRRARLPYAYEAAVMAIEYGGGQVVSVNGQAAILINYNMACYEGLCPNPHQRIYMTPQGPVLVSVQEISAYGVPPEYYQVITRDLPVCR